MVTAMHAPALVRVAYHEAGHVVWKFGRIGIPIGAASIEPRHDSAGRVTGTDGARGHRRALRHVATLRALPPTSAWNLTQNTLAGHAAEAVYLDTRALWASPEFASARALIGLAHGFVEAGSVFHSCWTATCEWIAQPTPWAGVTALAHALLAKRTLTCDQALDIVLAAMRTASSKEEILC